MCTLSAFDNILSSVFTVSNFYCSVHFLFFIFFFLVILLVAYLPSELYACVTNSSWIPVWLRCVLYIIVKLIIWLFIVQWFISSLFFMGYLFWTRRFVARKLFLNLAFPFVFREHIWCLSVKYLCFDFVVKPEAIDIVLLVLFFICNMLILCYRQVFFSALFV